MCIMELVDFNENMLGRKTVKKAKTTRRGAGKKTTAPIETSAIKAETSVNSADEHQPENQE